MSSTTRRALAASTLAIALMIVPAGAEQRARVRPIEGGPVATGTGTLEDTRKQLEGRWNLASAEVWAQ